MIQQIDAQRSAAPRRKASVELPLSDYFQALLRNLKCSDQAESEAPRLIGITSCAHGEGVSTVAVNLSLRAASDLGERILVVDLSDTQASVSKFLGDIPRQGLSDMLLRGVEPVECIQRSAVENIAALGLGSLRQQWNSSIDRHQIRQLLVGLKPIYDRIVVDLPTATPLGGGSWIAGVVDGVILVVEAERIRSQVAQHAKEQLIKSGSHLLGVVFNKRRHYVPDWLYRRL